MKLKTCSVCKIGKPLCEFSPDRSKKDGHRSDCMACAADRRRKARKIKALEATLKEPSKAPEEPQPGRRWVGERRERGDRRERLRMLKRHDRQTRLIQEGKRPPRRGPDWYEELVQRCFGSEDEQIDHHVREGALEDRIEALEVELKAASLPSRKASIRAELTETKRELSQEDEAELARTECFYRGLQSTGRQNTP